MSVSRSSSNIGVKHKVSLGKVKRLPLFACFGVCGTSSTATYTGVPLVNTFKYLGLVTRALRVVRPTTVGPIIDCKVITLVTFPR
jgi:hypothetical protein